MNSKVMIISIGTLVMLTAASHGVKMASIEKWEADANVRKLIKTIKDKNPEMRIAAIEALGRIKDEKAVDPLAALFSDNAPQTTDAAIKALIDIGNDAADPHLIKALALQSDSAQILAATALGERKSLDALDSLIRVLGERPDTVAAAAAIALGKLADPKAIPALAGNFQYGSHALRLACAGALRSIGGEEAAQAILPCLGDMNKQIRQIAIDTFVELDKRAIPYAFETLQHEELLTRTSGLAIYQGLNAIPSEGGQAVWYMLAETTAVSRKRIDPVVAEKLANLKGETVPSLVQALQYRNPILRSTAARALELIGESCVDYVLDTALTKSKPDARKWLANRRNWHGAPSWRIDLWAARTALNPLFGYESRWVAMLKMKDGNARQAMKSDSLKPKSEYVPLLINQLASSPNVSVTINFFGITKELKKPDFPNEKKNLVMAMDRLAEMGKRPAFPLMAALNDSDPQLANACAEVLARIRDDRAIEPLLEQLEKRTAKGENLFESALYTAVQKLGYTRTDGVMTKVRPNTVYAQLFFGQAYPDAEIKRVQSGDRQVVDPTSPAAFKMHYIMNGQEKSHILKFQRTVHGAWIPRPSLPEKLP